MTKQRDGVRYARPPVVETNIDDALHSDPTFLPRRLLVTDRGAPDYLRSECLIHLIREAHRAGDDRRRDTVLPILLGRCEAILKAKVSEQLPNAAALREEVLSEFCELLIADGTGQDPDTLDYYECRFNHAFRTLRIDTLRRELRATNRAFALPDETDVVGPEADEDAFARLSEAFKTPATQQSTLFLNDLWEAINALPTDERKAVILVHVLGYDEESDKPDKVTAATLCDCTGRTIRNRLSRAAEKLARFKEDA
ncbi:hypothetical protein [Lichenicoccus sp.]|uniref:hypothetical protein n=1 Tax=Lichenicoccus sp. TaxID=2781899 RepID=UPI003D115169